MATKIDPNPPLSPPGDPAPGSTLSDRLSSILRYDLPSSIVVFLVALPLSLGIAIASGAPVAAGLIAAVVGGIVAGSLGGSALQVSGPAAGLTVIVAESINQFGWRVTGFIVVAAGVLQILFGLSRIARAALAVAPVVVHAMLAGIGVTIALQQVHVLLGGDSESSAWANITSLPAQLGSVHIGGAFVGLVVIAVMLGWKYMPERVRVVPGPLVAILLATVLSLVLPTDVQRIELNGSLFDAIGLPALPSSDWAGVALMILTFALIASVESLLSAVAIDKMHTGPRANFDREMIGQGSANVVSGLLGGLPVTGVIVRSSTNVVAGARSRASAVLHGVWVLLFSVALVGLVQQIPMAALAGLLIVIGVQLVKTAHIKLAHRTGDLIVYAVTLAGVVFLNLLEGVLIGLALAFALLLWRIVRVTVEAKPLAGSDRWLVSIDGSCTFLALPKLSTTFAKVPAGVDVTVEMTVDFLDHAAYEAIIDWARQHEANGGTVDFVEIGAARMEAATSAPPARSFGRVVLDDVLGPWRVSDRKEKKGSDDIHDPIVSGIAAYHRGHAHLVRPHLDELRDRQDPDSFFLTCSDSRIVPNIITNSGPGDLFTVRNVGNLVPEHGDASVESALVFALQNLCVRSVVVCGHSSCGAMTALHSGQPCGPEIDSWLEHARPSLDRFRDGHPVRRAAEAAGFGEVDQLSMVNIAVQLEHLHRHPVVSRAVAERGVTVSGLFFDIASARVIEVSVDGIAHIDESGRRVATQLV
ncbi:carbonic anhydrase [Nocardia cyriacigeorgica]|uniref:carbonic anhydrase n=1 Tax=Nocardia cyriacigeorgica TaxID=135487 RepID=A0A6P1D1P8_9NOCA|nr:bifunctional SulP family inorganic anion transporter/carbonic anhydrase [Nocardia cyriacigeorgica]NEW40582.1 carbonic anhydrase [Nocardia cyriacigeorgica]NEW42963.1 carbonic anhydrase [Nocardia cyriacigeorgica]NEW53314.1 carbonic anhydrase [Nocardia cyriacigeorgica]NEW59105.1 carbonic anhydrase [Nocardia cyriacigeorgica]